MKLVHCIAHDRDRNRLSDELLKAGFQFTLTASTGGFLREGNSTLLIGTEEEKLEELIGIIRSNCQAREQLVNAMPYEAMPSGTIVPSPVKVKVGGAVVFVTDVERFESF